MWYLLLNDDEKMIADAVRSFLSSELPIERLRPHAAPLNTEKVRRGMAELGWFGLGLPESAGGSGLGLVEEMLIQRECGYFLASPSVLANVMAAHVAHGAGNRELVEKIISGDTSAALVIPTSLETSTSSTLPVMALDWSDKDLLLMWTDEGMGLYAAESFTEVTRDESLDDSVTMHAGTLDPNQALCWVGTDENPLPLRAQVLLAARLVGLADHACDLAVEYAKVREQFGKPIGSFQAIKHRCADMGVRTRLSWYQTGLAGLKVQSRAADAPLQAASAKLLAAQAAHENGRAGIQIHGAIGFQAECDAHWFVKRTFVYDQMGGNLQTQVNRVIAEPSPLW